MGGSYSYTDNGRSRSGSSLEENEGLLVAVRQGDLDGTKKFLEEHPEALNARITHKGQRALHIAAMYGHLHIVESLVHLMSAGDLELMDNEGATALMYAAQNSDENVNINVAKCMVDKNPTLVSIPFTQGWIAVTWTLDLGHNQMARYLYSVTPLEALLPENGIHDVALELVRRCQKLVTTKVISSYGLVSNFLLILAKTPLPLSLHECQLPFWKRLLDNCKWGSVPMEPASAINEVVVAVPETDHQTSRDHYSVGAPSPREEQYLALLRASCNAISPFHDEAIDESGIRNAVIIAAERGNVGFIVEALKAHFSLLWTSNEDGRSLFSVAVQNRQAQVYNLMHGLTMKSLFLTSTDRDRNSMLHMAALQAPPPQLTPIPGALLQMQRELQWFKEVESITPPVTKERLNSEGMTARKVFTTEHKDLVKEGEKWTKETASSCSVVAALVATITFAAAFTVPGGNDQNKRYPIFLHKNLFMLFIISDALSLFSSTTSLLMFLGLLTSRYAEDDFLRSLPTKLIIGLSTMFISLATMMAAFCAALFLMLRGRSWIVIPVTLLAFVPVTLYIWLQLPLLIVIFKSTYGAGIFDRNVKSWL
ncbi:protein ACCELERATED CELL DEATH 6-like [Arachis stenosperma]|uniref:protein ACCELERATED CELL DEATH 6-like n=1 Tax=Arachis stenosperma TaxID=217475 RepID=UPI0025ACAD37|nr:protein ACCELERATED CELL DEATH 6-like [Arachis stenosperma]